MPRTERCYFLASLAAFAPMCLSAQVVRGAVRDLASGAPIAAAVVSLTDSAGDVVGVARTDSRGRFTLRSPAGSFVMRAARIGFAPDSVLSSDDASPDTTNVEIALSALPVGLTPVRVEEERRQIRNQSFMGLNLKTLGTNIIAPSEIRRAAQSAPRTFLDVLRVLLPAGVQVSERSKCVFIVRARGIDGSARCAMVYVDGNRLDRPEAAEDLVQPQWLDHAIFVRPNDAGMRFGTGAEAGVLLLFTKFGGFAAGDEARIRPSQ